jgi:phospholipase/carboxylesterase
MSSTRGGKARKKSTGIMALSCFLPLADAVAIEASPANRDTPIFMAHGTHDPLIPLARGRHAHDLLTSLGYRPDWHEYPMSHSVCAEEVDDIAARLTALL